MHSSLLRSFCVLSLIAPHILMAMNAPREFDHEEKRPAHSVILVAPKEDAGKKNLCLSNSVTNTGTLWKRRDVMIGTVAHMASVCSSWAPSLFSKTPENALLYLSQLKAKKIFWNSYNTVPAYKHFVEKNCPNTLPTMFDDIPVTSKANYIKQYPITQTLTYGKFPERGQIDTSTGTSGKPTKWIRGYREMENVKKWIRIASHTALGNKPFIFCNMFALGPWATGMTSAYALSGNQLVVSIGPDIEKMHELLKDIGTDHRYVIAGYPPHMKKLVETAPFDLREYDISIVVGGEAMSENVHKSILDKGIKAVFSSYGASDLRINIAQQTEFEQTLQKICRENPQFKKELLGTLDGTPIFFHYNPLLDYIEETKDGRLLFTDLDQERISPRIRYDLGDNGKILKVSAVQALIKKYRYDLAPRTNLPLICLYGRGDDALTFNGCNIMYDELDIAIAKIPGLYSKVNRYAYNKFETKTLDQQLDFWIELKKDVTIKDIGMSPEELNAQLITALAEINQDFKSQIIYIQNNKDSHLPEPCTFVYECGTSPMVPQSEHHKNKYVYDVPRARSLEENSRQ